MRLRSSVLRVLGLVVAAAVLAAATQLLALSFETDPLISRARLDDVDRWLSQRPLAGPGVLLGAALLAVSAWLLYVLVRSFGTERRVITMRKKDGWTKLDAATLEDAIEREVSVVDRRNDIDVRIRRSGRVDASVIMHDPRSLGSVHEVRDAIDAICASRGLPCRSGRITTSTPRRSKRSRTVR